MLEEVKGTMSFWTLILNSRRKLGKIFSNKICYKYTHLNYLFNNLFSHVKNLIDNEAVWFGLERTSYTPIGWGKPKGQRYPGVGERKGGSCGGPQAYYYSTRPRNWAVLWGRYLTKPLRQKVYVLGRWNFVSIYTRHITNRINHEALKLSGMMQF